MQEQKDVLLTADIGGTNCRFSLWQANIKADVVYDEVFTKVSHHSDCCIPASNLNIYDVYYHSEALL